MRILFIMPGSLSIGGIETMAIGLANSLRQNGHIVDFVCHGQEEGLYEQQLVAHGVKVFHVQIKSRNYVKMVKQFNKILDEGNYDVVHAHMNATSGIYLKIAAKKKVKVLVAHSHASSMKAFTKNIIKAGINQIEKRKTNRYANVKIACSRAAGEWLFGKADFYIILNAVDIYKFAYSEIKRKQKRIELGITNEETVLLHVGEFSKNKNQIFLIQVLIRLLEMGHNSRLIFVGKGNEQKKVVKYVQQLQLEEKVTFLKNRMDVNEILQAADVFLLPSKSEGNPVSLAEAATAGLHCVVSDAVPKDIIPYFSGDMIDFLPINGKFCVQKWVDAISEKKKRIQYGESNPCELCIENMTFKIEKLYMDKIGDIHIKGGTS